MHDGADPVSRDTDSFLPALRSQWQSHAIFLRGALFRPAVVPCAGLTAWVEGYLGRSCQLVGRTTFRLSVDLEMASLGKSSNYSCARSRLPDVSY